MILPKFYTLKRYDRLDSTMDEMRRLMDAEQAVEGLLVLAEQQTLGRGRRGRTWVSEKGNLYLSLALKMACLPLKAAEVSFVTSVALRETLRSFIPPKTNILYKWPNDLLIEGRRIEGHKIEERKIAGILLEAVTFNPPRIDWLTVGVGVNILSCPKEAEIKGALKETQFKGSQLQATSLREWTSQDVSVEDVLSGFASRFLSWREVWHTQGFPPIRQEWLKHGKGLGKQITIMNGKEAITGRFVDLNEEGRLILESETGKSHSILVGDLYTDF